jgi:hypothetical protein
MSPCSNCFRPTTAVSSKNTLGRTLGCIVSGQHGGRIDDYYCTDGGTVTLCENHLKTATVVVYDDSVRPAVPVTVKYYNEVYSKK